MSGVRRNLFSAHERFAGFARALGEAGVAVDDSLVRFGPYERAAGRAAVHEMMFGAAPTALFAGSDYIAIGAIAGLREMGLDAPRDLSARWLRRYAFCRAAPSAVDDGAPTDRGNGSSGRSHAACSDELRYRAGSREASDGPGDLGLGLPAPPGRSRRPINWTAGIEPSSSWTGASAPKKLEATSNDGR